MPSSPVMPIPRFVVGQANPALAQAARRPSLAGLWYAAGYPLGARGSSGRHRNALRRIGYPPGSRSHGARIFRHRTGYPSVQ